MKTALIIGGAAIAVYAVWKYGIASAAAPLAATSQPIYPTNTPYPAAPPTTAPSPLTAVSTAISSLFAKGIIASVTPIGPVTADNRASFTAHGAVITGGNAYAPGPNAPSAAPAPVTSLTAVSNVSWSGVQVPTVSGLAAAPQRLVW